MKLGLISLGMGTWIALSGSVSAQPDMTEKAVQQVAQKGCDAFKKDNYQDFLKVADVPWFAWDKGLHGTIIEKRESLSELLGRVLGGNDPLKSVTTTKPIPYKEYRKKLAPEDQKMLDRALSLTDWVVWITFTDPNGGQSSAPLFVARRGNQWKIVGWDGSKAK